MVVEYGEEIGHIEEQMTSEVDDKVISKKNQTILEAQMEETKRKEWPKRATKRTGLKSFSTKSWGKQTQTATNTKLQVS